MSTPTKSRLEVAFAPAILTAIALGIGASLAAFFPLLLVALYAITLPVALLILWVGRDVEAPIDRIERVDAERAKLRVVRRAEPKVFDLAA